MTLVASCSSSRAPFVVAHRIERSARETTVLDYTCVSYS